MKQCKSLHVKPASYTFVCNGDQLGAHLHNEIFRWSFIPLFWFVTLNLTNASHHLKCDLNLISAWLLVLRIPVISSWPHCATQIHRHCRLATQSMETKSRRGLHLTVEVGWSHGTFTTDVTECTLVWNSEFKNRFHFSHDLIDTH